MIASYIVPVVREFLDRCYCSNISLDVTPRVKSVSFFTRVKPVSFFTVF